MTLLKQKKLILDAIAKDPSLASRMLNIAKPTLHNQVIDTAASAFRVMQPFFAGRSTEAYGVLALNTRNKIIGFQILTEGSDAFTVVCVRQTMRWALLQGSSGARSIVIAHNHPSGDPEPSSQDMEVTRRVALAGKSIDIPLFDHIVLSDNGFVSFAERGLINRF
jgi:DNA repair protein RadC